MAVTRLMLGRRPEASTQQAAFGHVALNAAAQAEVETVVDAVTERAIGAKRVAYDPDDAPQTGEVMTHPVAGIDAQFQPAAPWSLERAVKAIAISGKPAFLDRTELAEGAWTFYTLRADVRGKPATLFRATSPTRALKHANRIFTQFVAGELKPLRDPLVGLDHDADAVVWQGTAYIFRPQRLERLLIDAEEIKSRAPQIVSKFASGLGASLSPSAQTWIEKACSENSNVGRRVERLNRRGGLSAVTVPLLRAGLKDARLDKNDFGTKPDVIDVASLDHAIAVVDLAADLYYQPRFEKSSRKVASYRRLD